MWWATASCGSRAMRARSAARRVLPQGAGDDLPRGGVLQGLAACRPCDPGHGWRRGQRGQQHREDADPGIRGAGTCQHQEWPRRELRPVAGSRCGRAGDPAVSRTPATVSRWGPWVPALPPLRRPRQRRPAPQGQRQRRGQAQQTQHQPSARRPRERPGPPSAERLARGPAHTAGPALSPRAARAARRPPRAGAGDGDPPSPAGPPAAPGTGSAPVGACPFPCGVMASPWRGTAPSPA
jgi:hypothetical protein